ncbi:MAG: adenylate/guanylate cyclase domain-containing protein [Verrucomicrobiales bacterium]|nr:adenylate/guanylate cyclase domain-containing protein [Verrucomicrobiales bacterium]
MILAALNQENPLERTFAELKTGRVVRIGRKPVALDGEDVDLLKIPWKDRLISRNHFSAHLDESGGLVIDRLPALGGRSKPNALYSNVPSRDREELDEPLRLSPGDSFCVGLKGSTSFFCLTSVGDLDEAVEKLAELSEAEAAGLTPGRTTLVDYDDVEQLNEYSLRLQLKMLQRELPEQVLSGWTDEEELFSRTARFLEGSLPGQKGVSAGYVSISKIDGEVECELLNRDPTARADFRPSKTLLAQLDLEHPTKEDVHIWSSKEDRRVFRVGSLGTEIDWVSVIPVASMEDGAEVYRDESGRPVYQYVVVRQATETAAASFVPFLRLIASLVASLLQAREEQRIQDRMATYFSPALRSVMGREDEALFEPAMVDCSVVFADRRGSSRILEKANTDEEILDRLRENQEIVSEITGTVFEHEGVITDFSGDGALALWGWPKWVESKRAHARKSVEAAEKIVQNLADHVEFEEEHGRLMSSVRLGVSTGRIAVGKTGPSQQWHISVFGGVANLGARLERIAKEFKVPILISSETRERLVEDKRVEKEGRLLRKLCFIQPAGFDQSYPIFELVQPKDLGGSGVSREKVKLYEQALEFFIDRDWDDCIDLLRPLSEEDEPSLWLMKRALKFRKNPPDEPWQGQIRSLIK